MLIKAVVEEIIFRNPQNSYTVVGLDHNGEYLIAVGIFPQIEPGQTVEMEGSFSTHSKYGEQFNASQIKVSKPSSKEGIVRYLSSGLIKGVGPITALAIVEKFGESTLDIIEFNPDRLVEVRGISTTKAADIAKAFSEIKRMQEAVLFLQSYNITTNMAVKIYNTYGNNTEQILKENPYKLIEDIDGVGFFTADKIAQKLGIGEFSEYRVRAGLLHVLKENSDKSGNTFIYKPNLLNELSLLLKLNENDNLDLFEKVIGMLVLDGIIKATDFNGSEIVSLTKVMNIEKYVAMNLIQLNLNNSNDYINIENSIDFFEQQNNIKMHEMQKEAVRVSVNSGVSVITGGPGTGKTTIIKCVLQAFKSLNKTVKLLAPTGRAAKRLSESTDIEASTIHRGLEVDYNNLNLFNYNSSNKLPYDVVIIDEVSMVDIYLFHYLIRALKNNAKLILVGDKDQLPSVGAGNVLSDILQSGVINSVELTHIYRQSEDSLIITNAHLINSGNFPVINNKSKDFFFYEETNSENMLRNIVEMQSTRIPKFLNIDNSKIQVLAPMKKGVCGVDNLNAELQEKNNPFSTKKPEVNTDKIIFRLGDRVMQIINNYEREWKKDFETGAGVFNGDCGIISNINPYELELEVLFEDGRLVKYNKSDIYELVLSYAITIHKSQGSEFDVVIIPLVGGPPMLLTKNLLYTAVTRAKKMVVLVGSKANINRMIKNNFTTTRNTLLKNLLIETNNTYSEVL